MMELLADPNVWASLATLVALEIVLGIDNVIFLSIVAGKLPVEQQKSARLTGLALALIMRIGLLASIAWIVKLTDPLISAFGMDFSARDLILLAGGLFLLFKGTREIHESVEGEHDDEENTGSTTFVSAILQIMVLDIVFSLDSVITAVGMANHLEVMIAAVIISVIVMMVASGPVAAFIEKHPTTKMLAMSFLLLVGVSLVADGMHFHIPREYLYFAIVFSVLVEVLNLAASKRAAARRAKRKQQAAEKA